MKKVVIAVCLAAVAVITILFWSPISSTLAQIDIFNDREPDIPAMLRNAKNSITKEEFLEQRAISFGIRRGINNDMPVDPQERPRALAEMDRQADSLTRRPNSPEKNALLAPWTAIGPAPIIAGGARYSGRVIAIAVHPTNPDIVYVGAAQGGLYRSTNGGASWSALMDGAQSLAIGAIAISKSDPEIVYVGTGEPNFSADSFFGVGVYRINNASTTANLTGPLNKDSGSADVFTGRGVAEIIVHPTDSNTIFVATTSGVGGIGGAANNILPSRGIYRSTNAAGATPTFAKLTGLAANVNASVRDLAIDPNNPNILVAGLVAAGPTGGIYRSVDALAANPTFTQTQSYTGTSTSELTTELTSIHPPGDTDATFYAATGNLGGRVLRSTDGGASWIQQVDNNFCTPQCFYDVAIAVDPTNASRLYLGGSPTLIAGFSTTAGTGFTEGGSGVHVDTQAIEVAPSNPAVVYLGTDGGIYKSTNSGASYTHLNTAEFFATQFMGLSVHPTDPNFTIGGTQDNGTNFFDPTGTSWNRVDGGDGGYTVIDQNAVDNTNVRMYHTYFSQTNNVVGYATRATTSGGWGFRGCNSGTPNNGITCGDAVLFYAPLESGPGNPNSVYYGTDRLYRTIDNGTNHTVVSQAPITAGVPISAIGISPQDDNIRIIGQRAGGLFGTNTGSSTLDNYDPTGQVTDGFISRAVIDPNNSAIAYVTLSNFGVPNVFKTTNLNTGTPTWTNISGTIPAVPVSAFIVDPTNSNTLYAGTDIGVYVSTDAGANWTPFGTGLPRVAVFDMAIANGSPRKLRVATHGKGMYEVSLAASLIRSPFDFDGDSKTDLSIFRPGPGEWWYLRSSNGSNGAVTFGNSTDKLVPGDYTGDGKADVAIFRPSNGNWFVLRSEDFSFFAFPFGTDGDVPAPGDYDGDGRTDATVFRPSTSTWFIQGSVFGTVIQTFGTAGDVPVNADYDGDGRSDIAIYRPSLGQWWIQRSTGGSVFAVTFGANTDKTVQGDFTGDGKADIAIWRPSNGNWFVLRSEDLSFFSFPFGTTGDVPTPGDYDGDGKFDAAVFRPTGSTWFVQRSTAGTLIQAFGTTGDLPVPNAYVR
ncbi:MAG: VCBS repeat-containing protein [Pyrinomonadaceae bacterium]|nr:VCBS repeat-containing protein [Acidobacteriota bacterium]MBP7376410.1 VCBS repeat-containing protein [Pyrinomonadaceae bacterium]